MGGGCVSPYDDRVLRDFLLGRTLEPERAKIEDAILADEAFYEYVAAVEAELVDAYTRGDLSDADREAFKARYVDGESSANLLFSKQFAALVDRERRYLEYLERVASHGRPAPTSAESVLQELPAAALGSPGQLEGRYRTSRPVSPTAFTRLRDRLNATWFSPAVAGLATTALVVIAATFVAYSRIPHSHFAHFAKPPFPEDARPREFGPSAPVPDPSVGAHPTLDHLASKHDTPSPPNGAVFRSDSSAGKSDASSIAEQRRGSRSDGSPGQQIVAVNDDVGSRNNEHVLDSVPAARTQDADAVIRYARSRPSVLESTLLPTSRLFTNEANRINLPTARTTIRLTLADPIPVAYLREESPETGDGSVSQAKFKLTIKASDDKVITTVKASPDDKFRLTSDIPSDTLWKCVDSTFGWVGGKCAVLASMVDPGGAGQNLGRYDVSVIALPKSMFEYEIIRATPGTPAKINPSQALGSGEKIRIQITSRFDGYLYALLQWNGGEELLFPPTENVDGERYKIKRFERMTLPEYGWLELGREPGVETLTLLAVPSRISRADGESLASAVLKAEGMFHVEDFVSIPGFTAFPNTRTQGSTLVINTNEAENDGVVAKLVLKSR
jgi:hypothetical protein